MPDWPVSGGGGRQTIYGLAVFPTAAVTTNTKGSWFELTSATAHRARSIYVELGNHQGGDYLVDVAIGAGGSEQTILANLTISGNSGQRTVGGYPFNIPIPAGARIAARCQCTTGSRVVEVTVTIFEAGFGHTAPFGRVVTYGAVSTAKSGGTQIDPGGTINTKGSYSELVSATTAPIREILVALNNKNNGTRTSTAGIYDVAIGAVGSEQIVIPNARFSMDDVIDMVQPFVAGPFPVRIPVGSRLAMRCQNGINDASDRLMDAIIYGSG